MNALSAGEVDEPLDLVIRGGVLSHDVITQCAVGVRGGRIALVSSDPDASVDAVRERRLEPGEVLIPGIIDSHVHINEPGRTEWEGFDFATRAAVAGGVTTVIDMPLNSNPPTLTVEALELKRSVAASKAYCELGFWGGVDMTNLGHLRPLWDAGVFGFKCFLSPSGVDEYGSLGYPQLEDAMSEIASFGGRLIIHSEDPAELAVHAGHVGASYRSFAESRPASCEATAVEHVMELVRRTGCRTHILHVSAASTVSVLAGAKADGLPVTAETCPHYLTLDCDHIPDDDTAFKCCPPIRDLKEQDGLWKGLVDGTLDIVVTDHSPTTAAMKAGSLATAWGGVSSLQVGFRAVLTQARRRGLGLADVVRWMSSNVASFAGFGDRGAIAEGRRADLVVIRPDDTFVVDASRLASRNPISAFDGMTLNGVVSDVLVGGRTPAAGADHLISRPSR
ncbi:allantoinase AllB [uncultured Bifidobacterium sp.]|uniref:allantoinase AllB n=1 Tax=uncultured Bifidobacterium sp. TaxID=165187 RepID=UPI0028DCF295|nr:allantoinase AllB [uncultured Bifidobacterium sp.]